MAGAVGRPARSGMETRETILDVSLKLFASKGYLGASLSDIVSKVGIAKPSLFHHFPNKERLYAAVLDRIADSLIPIVENCERAEEPEQGLIQTAIDLDIWCQENPDATCIVMRDMLDMDQRAAPPKSWPLAIFITAIEDLHKRLPKGSTVSNLSFQAFLALYLGSINYMHLSRDTLTGMGKLQSGDFKQSQKELLEILKKLLNT
ncbi:MAG: TetR/AcrR family transcriptional regulator [Sneathiellales bacterium]|nr:TetR/AcrR family transcriptional regulator [Sneathiellales bacterium]